MNARRPRPQGSRVKRAIGGRYIHPDWGSPVKGVPPMAKGFHAGMCPPLIIRPSKQPFGKK
jgi:hypothetical protein